MTNTYQLSKEQFDSLIEDSNIPTPKNITTKDLDFFKSLLIPQLLESYPELTTDIIIHQYLKNLVDYVNEDTFNSLVDNNKYNSANPSVLKLYKYYQKNDTYNISPFLDNISKDHRLDRKFMAALIEIKNNPSIFYDVEHIRLCIETLKYAEQNKPIQVTEEDGILKIKAHPYELLAHQLSQNFLIETFFAYPEYQKYKGNDNSSFDISYNFPMIFDHDDFSDIEIKDRFNELLIDNSAKSLEFYDSAKDKVMDSDSATLLLSIDSKVKNPSLKLELYRRIIDKDTFTSVLLNDIKKYQKLLNPTRKSIFDDSDDYDTSSLSIFTLLSNILNIPPQYFYAYSKDKSQSHGLSNLLMDSFHHIVNSQEFIQLSEIIRDNPNHLSIQNTLQREHFFTLYPLFPQEVKENLSVHFISYFLAQRKKIQLQEDADYYNQGFITPMISPIKPSPNNSRYHLNIFEEIPFYDAFKNGALTLKDMYSILSLPNLDVELICKQPQIRLIFKHIIEEISNITPDVTMHENKLLFSFKIAETPKILFSILDNIITSGLEDPFSQLNNYSDEKKARISLFKKENWIEANQSLSSNIVWDYSFKIALSQAIADVLHKEPSFYQGTASKMSSFELAFYNTSIPIASILSKDFREIFSYGEINKNILHKLIVKDHFLIEDKGNLEKLPLSIRNSPEFHQILRTPEFFRGHTSTTYIQNFFLSIYDNKDSDFLLEQLFSEDYEHSIDFTKHNPELLTFLPQEKLEDPQFWIKLVSKEKQYLGSSFMEDSLIFDVIPDTVLKNTFFIQHLLDHISYNEVLELPKICFTNNENVIKVLELLKPESRASAFINFLQNKVPELYPLYDKLSKSNQSIDMDAIQKILIISNEAILEKTIPVNTINTKPLKF